MSLQLLPLIFPKSIVYLVCVLSTFLVKAQNPLYTRFTVSDGLSKQSIYYVSQDSKGLIWLGTDEGILRFDGKTFQKFPAREEYRKGVTNILESENGTIYCQNFAGQVFQVSEKNDSIIHVENIISLGRYTPKTMVDRHFIAYCGKNNIELYDTRTGEIIRTSVSSAQTTVSTFKKDSPELYVLDLENHYLGKITPRGTVSKQSYASKAPVLFHLSINNTNYVVNRTYPFDVVEVSTGKNKSIAGLSEDVIINHISAIDNQLFGIYTTSGVYIYNSRFELIWHWFENESISGGFKDVQNNYWFSTLRNGLILVTQPNVRIGIEDQELTCIASNRNSILVGTAANSILETRGLKMTNVLYQDPTHHAMRNIFFNEQTKELVFSNQFFHVLSGNQKLKKPLSVNHVSAIGPHLYLLAEANNVYIFSSQKNSGIPPEIRADFPQGVDGKFLLSDRVLRAEHAEQIGPTSFLAATTDGLMELTPSKSTELLYNNKKVFSNGLCKWTPDSTLIATLASGVLLFYDHKIEEYLPKKALQQGPVKKIKSNKNLLYILYANALDVFDGKKNKLHYFSSSDGWNGYTFNDLEIHNDSIYIASNKGLIAFSLGGILLNTQPPVIKIISSTLNQQKVDFSNILKISTLKNHIEIDFAIIDYQGLQTTRGYYSINDGEWLQANGNKITLTSLASGHYSIKIKAINDRGIESVTPVELLFSIPTPWYSSWWFLSLVALVLVLIVVAFFRRRIRNVERTNQLLKEKIDLEKALHQSALTSIKSQMNPHFIFNALNTIQSYIYTNDKRAASDYLVDFSELTRLILAMSSQETVSLSDEIKANQLYLRLEKMRFEDDFDYEIQVVDIDPDSIRIPAMLIQPYLENAVKHGLLHKKNDKKLKLIFSADSELLHVDVIDNGIGIAASLHINRQRPKSHQSFAMQANKKRFELLNSGLDRPIGEEIISLFDENKNAVGTHVKLKIPIAFTPPRP